MKLFITFVITLLLVATPQSIASSSLAAKDVQALPTEHVSRLTPSQAQALKLLALDDATHAKVIDRADPLKVAKFMEIYELFKKQNIESKVTYKEETFDFAIAYVPCEIAWHLRIVEFGEVIQCLEKSASWKAKTKVENQMLVNLFADKHTFELIQLLTTTDVDDEDLFLNLRKMVSSEGLFSRASTAFFLQHALALYKKDPKSRERQEMVSNFLGLHLSALAVDYGNQQMLRALYTGLVQNAPTLFSGGLPEHTIAVVATRTKEDEYDIVIINSGAGIENHESTTEIQPKGFHTGASYNDAFTSKSVKATSYNPLVRIKEVDTMDLWSASYHSAPSMDRLYYVVKNASMHVVTEPLMPWEWTEAQGIGTCAATSVWFALHFYYQALVYENDLRLSMLDQAADDLKELQDKVEDLERKLHAHYQKARDTFKKAHKDHKTRRFDYDQRRVKDLALAKDRLTKSLHLRRTIILMALNEILRNLIVWHHELGDIDTKLLFDRSKGELFTKTTEYSKMMQRREVLADAIPQSMASFHSFWKLQEEKYEERQKTASGKEVASSSLLDSWHSIREDVRTMYNDAIRVLKSKSASEMVLAKEAFVAQKFKPIDVKSLDEHSSLAKILGYIINFGDSPALQHAISEHVEKHTKNADAAKYLIVLYACITKNVPLLNYLVMQQKLPLRYTIDTTKGDPKVSICWDLKTEQSIAALAAHEFVQHGQPLDAFPGLFRKSKKETQSIVNKFKDAYKEIAPIIDAEKPLQAEIDEAFKALVEKGVLAAIAYILPEASNEAVSNAFIETGNVNVLSLLIDLVKDPELLKQKIETSIKKNNAKIVEFLLPSYFRYEKRRLEIDVIKKRKPASDITGEPAKVRLPNRWIGAAYNSNAADVMELLAPFVDKAVVKNLFLGAAISRRYETARVLASYFTDNAIFTMIEEAKTSNQGGLVNALLEVYARKSSSGAMFLKAAKEGSLADLEKWMSSVNADTIGYALLLVAQKGKMDCFEKLAPHSTDTSIKAALSKLSAKDLRHPSVLKAISNASRLLACEELRERATQTSNVELMADILPFMSVSEVEDSFGVACKSEKSFEIVKLLLQFVSDPSIFSCLETAIEKEMESQTNLLLPHVERESLEMIVHTPEFKKRGESTRKAVENRMKNFPTEIAIELAFLLKDDDEFRDFLQKKLEEYNVKLGKDKADLACKDQQSCIILIESIGPSAFIFPLKRAIRRLIGERDGSAELEKLLPLVSSSDYCKEIADSFEDGIEETRKACAKKALKAEVVDAVKFAQNTGKFDLVKLLAPFLPPSGIIELLETSWSYAKLDAAHLEEILAAVPTDLTDDALRIAVRGDEKKRGESVHYLLPKASQAAIDEVYLFAKRIKFNDELLEKTASETVKAQGKEIERAVSTS